MTMYVYVVHELQQKLAFSSIEPYLSDPFWHSLLTPVLAAVGMSPWSIILSSVVPMVFT